MYKRQLFNLLEKGWPFFFFCNKISSSKERKTQDLPQGIEDEEGKVEVAFVGVVFECEENGVQEPQPANQTNGNKAIAWWTLIEIQHQSFIKKLQETKRTVVSG